MRWAVNDIWMRDSAFDTMAAGYDASFTTTALGRSLRSIVWERFDACFTDRLRLLDIGCGTGEDAVYLAQRGHQVLAIDVSAPMLELAADKTRRSGCAKRIELRRMSLDGIGAELAGERFDGVLSNFGVINCATRLGSLVESIAPLVVAGAPLVWVVMGRYVPWEWFWFLSRADWRSAFRRLQTQGATWKGMRIQYPTPRQVAVALSPHFQPRGSRALGLVLPPGYASGWLERRPRLLARLTRLDQAAARWQILAALADHYIMEARRAPTRAES